MGKSSTRQKELAEKRRFWRQHLETWKSSDLRQSDYCRQHQLKLHCFVYWKKKLRAAKQPGVSFVQLVPSPVIQSSAVCRSPALRLIVGQYQIEVESGFDPVTLKQLVHTLDRL